MALRTVLIWLAFLSFVIPGATFANSRQADCRAVQDLAPVAIHYAADSTGLTLIKGVESRLYVITAPPYHPKEVTFDQNTGQVGLKPFSAQSLKITPLMRDGPEPDEKLLNAWLNAGNQSITQCYELKHIGEAVIATPEEMKQVNVPSTIGGMTQGSTDVVELGRWSIGENESDSSDKNKRYGIAYINRKKFFVMSINMPVFNKKRDKALLFYNLSCSGICGHASFMFLSRKNGIWNVAGERTIIVY